MLVGLLLVLIQFVAAVPWLLALTQQPAPVSRAALVRRYAGNLAHLVVRLFEALGGKGRGRAGLVLGLGLLAALVAGAGFGLLIETTANPDRLESFGKAYASVLQLQLYA